MNRINRRSLFGLLVGASALPFVGAPDFMAGFAVKSFPSRTIFIGADSSVKLNGQSFSTLRDAFDAIR